MPNVELDYSLYKSVMMAYGVHNLPLIGCRILSGLIGFRDLGRKKKRYLREEGPCIPCYITD